MKAFIRNIYGGPEVLRLEEVKKPFVKDGHILVKVIANSANPADWHILRGKPYFARLTYGLIKPKYKIPGTDFSGVVAATGTGVTQFKVGDRVFGADLKGGAFAEYISVPETACGHMAEGDSFEEMSCVPMAGVTALQALVVHGRIKAGERVLINGSTGGVGHFAVQIAKAYGAHVTAVCSSQSAEFATSLGADNIIAYDKENIHQHNEKYDLVVDINGNLSYEDYQRMGQRGVMVGFTSMGQMMTVLLKKTTGKFPIAQFTAITNTSSLNTLASLIHEGAIKVHIEKTYSYKDIPAAISYIESMQTKGKVAMVWDDNFA